ncbi:hypothetical protein OBV_29960 [Oscillibacter valericigenes Sjm18-20]|nr:hypothetical protein OBV_29960 [Oscillibacter valericigenes Sjm18-20]
MSAILRSATPRKSQGANTGITSASKVQTSNLTMTMFLLEYMDCKIIGENASGGVSGAPA